MVREAELVSERKRRRQRLYRLEPVPLAEVQERLTPYERFWRERTRGASPCGFDRVTGR